MTKKIELIIDHETGETKTYHQPATIKGSAARVGLKIARKMEEVEGGIPDDELLDEMLQYVAEYAYSNQFSASELEDGLDARDLFTELSTQIGSMMSRTTDAPGKSTKAKKA